MLRKKGNEEEEAITINRVIFPRSERMNVALRCARQRESPKSTGNFSLFSSLFRKVGKCLLTHSREREKESKGRQRRGGWCRSKATRGKEKHHLNNMFQFSPGRFHTPLSLSHTHASSPCSSSSPFYLYGFRASLARCSRLEWRRRTPRGIFIASFFFVLYVVRRQLVKKRDEGGKKFQSSNSQVLSLDRPILSYFHFFFAAARPTNQPTPRRSRNI